MHCKIRRKWKLSPKIKLGNTLTVEVQYSLSFKQQQMVQNRSLNGMRRLMYWSVSQLMPNSEGTKRQAQVLPMSFRMKSLPSLPNISKGVSKYTKNTIHGRIFILSTHFQSILIFPMTVKPVLWMTQRRVHIIQKKVKEETRMSMLEKVLLLKPILKMKTQLTLQEVQQKMSRHSIQQQRIKRAEPRMTGKTQLKQLVPLRYQTQRLAKIMKRIIIKLNPKQTPKQKVYLQFSCQLDAKDRSSCLLSLIGRQCQLARTYLFSSQLMRELPSLRQLTRAWSFLSWTVLAQKSLQNQMKRGVSVFQTSDFLNFFAIFLKPQRLSSMQLTRQWDSRYRLVMNLRVKLPDSWFQIFLSSGSYLNLNWISSNLNSMKFTIVSKSSYAYFRILSLRLSRSGEIQLRTNYLRAPSRFCTRISISRTSLSLPQFMQRLLHSGTDYRQSLY